MDILLYFLLPVTAYLLGSIPTSIWIGKGFYGIDVRQHSSGNAGATNTIRVLGWKAGIPVFFVDSLKGFAAANLVVFAHIESGTNLHVNIQLLLGFCALIGHVFPIFADFKGGKGVATLLGVVIALSPIPAALTFGVFLIILFIFKYVSLGSIIAGCAFPIIIFSLFPESPISLKIASIIMSLVLISTHRKNIKRLLRGEESKASFLFKKK